MPATKDHEQIKNWATERGANPAVVKGTDGMLRFEFSESSEEKLEPISWDEFFEIFDEHHLDLLYDEDKESRFHKFVYPEHVKKHH